MATLLVRNPLPNNIAPQRYAEQDLAAVRVQESAKGLSRTGKLPGAGLEFKSRRFATSNRSFLRSKTSLVNWLGLQDSDPLGNSPSDLALSGASSPVPRVGTMETLLQVDRSD